MINIENLTAGYGAKTVLKGLNANAKAGEFIALLGPNGSGKSTLLKSLCGLIPTRCGHITVSGTAISDLTLRRRAQKISYLAQGRGAAAGLKVSDILEIGRAPYRGRLGAISAEGRVAINSAMDRCFVQDFKDRQFETLSGGEQARVLLARALAVEAPVLLADEPIAALDPFYQISTMEILKSEAKSGKVVIAALHDLALASQYADQVWLLSGGDIVAAGRPKAALSAQALKTVFRISKPQGGFQNLRHCPD